MLHNCIFQPFINFCFPLSPGSCRLQLWSVSIHFCLPRCPVDCRCQSGTKPDFLNELLLLYLLHVMQSLIFYCHVKGIQAQTVANFYLAFEAQLTIIPVINKVHSAQPVFGLFRCYFSTWMLCVGLFYSGTFSLRLIWKMLIQREWSHRLKRCLIFHVRNAFGWVRAWCTVSFNFCVPQRLYISEKCFLINDLIFFRSQLNSERTLRWFSKRLWTGFHRKEAWVVSFLIWNMFNI